MHPPHPDLHPKSVYIRRDADGVGGGRLVSRHKCKQEVLPAKYKGVSVVNVIVSPLAPASSSSSLCVTVIYSPFYLFSTIYPYISSVFVVLYTFSVLPPWLLYSNCF